MTLSSVLIVLLCNGIIGSEVQGKKPGIFEIFENIKLTSSNFTEIEDSPSSEFRNILSKLLPSSVLHHIASRQNRFFQHADYINQRFETLQFYKKPEKDERSQVRNLRRFAKQSTTPGFHKMSPHLEKFISAVIPSNNYRRGIFHLYLNHMNTMIEKDHWCLKGQSISSFIFNSLRYCLDIIKKGFSIILQSYAIRKLFNAGDFDAAIVSEKGVYSVTVTLMTDHFKELAFRASTRLAACEPRTHLRNETYLELEKLFQGIIVEEILLNKDHSAKGSCADYQNDIVYHPYEGIWSNGDWKCHGLMYNCFRPSYYHIDLCKPSTASRRIDGLMEKDCLSTGCWLLDPYQGMGNFQQCLADNSWKDGEWRHSMPSTWYQSETCACICDDSQHPKTLRKFSGDYEISDYRRNMVVTGIRLVNISNVIHIEIQQGKLKKFGTIEYSSVEWKPRRVVASEGVIPLERILTLSYTKRRVNLGGIYSTPDEVVIGAAFDWDDDEKGITLSVFVTRFSFSTGELNPSYRKFTASNGQSQEIALDKPDVPTKCRNNDPVRGANKFINFQTTDWKKDAAQTTIPYVDIQEVVGNPPTMLSGAGLYYKNANDCGGYIGIELYSHKNVLFYNNTWH